MCPIPLLRHLKFRKTAKKIKSLSDAEVFNFIYFNIISEMKTINKSAKYLFPRHVHFPTSIRLFLINSLYGHTGLKRNLLYLILSKRKKAFLLYFLLLDHLPVNKNKTEFSKLVNIYNTYLVTTGFLKVSLQMKQAKGKSSSSELISYLLISKKEIRITLRISDMK